MVLTSFDAGSSLIQRRSTESRMLQIATKGKLVYQKQEQSSTKVIYIDKLDMFDMLL